MASVIQIKRGTASSWTAANPTLAAGELGFETDTKNVKVGDGTTGWSSLGYTLNATSYVTLTGTQTLTNKTLTAPVIATISNTGTLTLPTSTDTLVGRATTDTLTNKTLTSPVINTPVITQGQSTPTFSTNAYTLAASDAGQLLLASNGSTAGTINIPTDATTNFAIGTQIHILQTGSGQLTVSATTPATTTVYSTGATAASPKCRVQYSALTLWKSAANTWYIFGDVA